MTARGRGCVHVVLPVGVDDASRPSGGNVYDRRVCDGLVALGWSVHEHAVAPDDLAPALALLPSGALVLLDGLLASPAPEVVVPAGARLRIVVLLHMPLGTAGETQVLGAAAGVVVTSRWTASLLPPYVVHVVRPGVDRAPLAVGTAAGGRLLCVGAVIRAKGHDVLLEALDLLDGLHWNLTCVGSRHREPSYAAEVAAHDRVQLTGPLVGAALEASYATADLLVLPTRRESYGMVVTEALAHGLPVVASDVGGVPEALGGAGGVLVPVEDPAALAATLRQWLTDPGQRRHLRADARWRRTTLAGWDETARRMSEVLTGVAA